MGSKVEFTEVHSRNDTCYYFDDIIKNRDIYSAHILLDK